MEAVVHFTPVKNTMQASAKIARFIASERKCEIFDKKLPKLGDYDIFYIVNSPSAFCPFLNELASWVGRVKMIWIMNDYTIYPPTQLRKTGVKMECWGTLKVNPYPTRSTYANLTEFKYINWNALSWQPTGYYSPIHEGIVYFGAFRKGRMDLFEKYFQAVPYPVYISCSPKVATKFHDLTDNCVDVIPVFQDLTVDLSKYQATIYMEDKFSRNVFTSPPNRFYEAASVPMPIFIDGQCTKGLIEAGVLIKNSWIVNCREDVVDCLRRSQEIGNEQSNAWYKTNPRKEMANEFHKRSN